MIHRSGGQPHLAWAAFVVLIAVAGSVSVALLCSDRPFELLGVFGWCFTAGHKSGGFSK